MVTPKKVVDKILYRGTYTQDGYSKNRMSPLDTLYQVTVAKRQNNCNVVKANASREVVCDREKGHSGKHHGVFFTGKGEYETWWHGGQEL